jgi:asparagine synthetase B (glutamine-hydrolysing)
MTAALAHQGPDGDGFFEAPRAQLGHRRRPSSIAPAATSR